MASANDERFSAQVQPLAGNGTGNSAAVNGSAAVCYMADVTRQMKEDVMFSTLLAQLGADGKYPGRPMDKSKEWHKQYWHVLHNLGWTMKTFSETEIGDASAYGSVDRLVVDIVGAELEGPEYALFLDMINALGKPTNSDPLWVFGQTAAHGHDASFQVGVVSNAGGNALFKCAAHQYYSKADTISSALFFPFEPASDIPYSAIYQTMELNANVYAQVREAVRERVSRDVWEIMFREIEL
ncbi:hypothetical protein C8Q73DRAFT_289991 [Cubamyces lactineus]|nr:hypothetical protein C8Q73DRAFT_289991 [Cubamyces lactineus]